MTRYVVARNRTEALDFIEGKSHGLLRQAKSELTDLLRLYSEGNWKIFKITISEVGK